MVRLTDKELEEENDRDRELTMDRMGTTATAMLTLMRELSESLIKIQDAKGQCTTSAHAEQYRHAGAAGVYAETLRRMAEMLRQ